jgi:hypothetical protein
MWWRVSSLLISHSDSVEMGEGGGEMRVK